MRRLLDQRLWIVTGKGGVGRSTLSAALALGAVAHGKNTLVCELDTQPRVAPLLGHAPAGPSIRALEPHLHSVNIQPEEAMREYGLMILKFEPLYRAVFENRMVRQFLRFVPSLQELVMLGKALFHVQERLPDGSPRYDTVVFDAPATGHAESLLRLPQVLLDTVPPGPLADEVRRMRDVLADEHDTALLCATLPEEMPISETFDWVRALRERLHLRPRAILLNQFVASRFDEAELTALASLPAANELARAHELRARRSLDALSTLRALETPVHSLPFVSAAAFGRGEAEILADALAPLLEVTP